MQQMLRFTCSGLVSFWITAGLFLGMLHLVNFKGLLEFVEDLDFSISYVQQEIDTKHRKRTKKKPTEVKKASQPPAMPRMQTLQKAQTDIPFASRPSSSHNMNILDQIHLPGLNTHVGQPGDYAQGGVKSGIPPMYPMDALMKGIEGWVKVKITVDALGQVSAVEVLDAYPPRVFNNAAIRTVQKWKFYQKLENNQAVPYQLSQTIDFKILLPGESE